MKRIISFIIVAHWACFAYGQTKVEKSIAVGAAQKIDMNFTWPKLITVKTWDRNEIKLVASVDINHGQNSDAFKIEMDKNLDGIEVTSSINNYESLPKKIVIQTNGQEYFFDTDDPNSTEIRKFKREHGNHGYDYMSHGVITEITLEVWVPADLSLDIYSKFGTVEVSGVTGNMKVYSKFGGIDVSSDGKGAIKAGTKFGDKYTNLESTVQSLQIGNHPGQWDWVQLGERIASAPQELQSEFGDVYIRKLK